MNDACMKKEGDEERESVEPRCLGWNQSESLNYLSQIQEPKQTDENDGS